MTREPPKIGATGQFPAGKLNEDDEGELAFAVGHENGLVRVEFGKPVVWMAMPADRALALAKALLIHAEACMK